MTHQTLILLFLFCTFCLPVAGMYLTRFRRRKKQQLQTIHTLCAKVESALNDHDIPGKEPAFSDSLSQATITTKFQQPRMELQAGKSSGVPEKYRFFANMAARGMSTADISEVLGISMVEAGQLAVLTCISRKDGCYK